MESFYTHTGEKPSQVSQETYNDLKSKEKSAARVDPKPSHDPRNPRKADLRREIDAWSLLVWAYKDECVRAAAGGTEDWSLRHERSSLCMAERRGGLINGWLQVHEDAVAVDAWARKLPRNDYWLIVDHAEKGGMLSPRGMFHSFSHHLVETSQPLAKWLVSEPWTEKQDRVGADLRADGERHAALRLPRHRRLLDPPERIAPDPALIEQALPTMRWRGPWRTGCHRVIRAVSVRQSDGFSEA
ncbi:hypothetical protein FHS85_003912 [Rhodoligotrophos appendicifer]|uniref:hypothetical protein n=1 Tax=Rhodoligotrophos appendicifer TaxID=987056 RepID=UPI001184AEE3|nr:hypothetical protein [Rhodoligotrophos appendicifer]